MNDAINKMKGQVEEEKGGDEMNMSFDLPEVTDVRMSEMPGNLLSKTAKLESEINSNDFNQAIQIIHD